MRIKIPNVIFWVCIGFSIGGISSEFLMFLNNGGMLATLGWIHLIACIFILIGLITVTYSEGE
jgi:hypothetical protein